MELWRKGEEMKREGDEEGEQTGVVASVLLLILSHKQSLCVRGSRRPVSSIYISDFTHVSTFILLVSPAQEQVKQCTANA